jgi:hypothetical protein
LGIETKKLHYFQKLANFPKKFNTTFSIGTQLVQLNYKITQVQEWINCSPAIPVTILIAAHNSMAVKIFFFLDPGRARSNTVRQVRRIIE